MIGVDLGGTKILAGRRRPRRDRRAPARDADAARLAGGRCSTALDEAVERAARRPRRARRLRHPVADRPAHGTVARLGQHPARRRSTSARVMSERFGLPGRDRQRRERGRVRRVRAGAGRGAEDDGDAHARARACGGGVMLDGALYRGWAEFGHIVIEVDGAPCQGACTGRGHLEAYVTRRRGRRASRRSSSGPAATRTGSCASRTRATRRARGPRRDRSQARRGDRVRSSTSSTPSSSSSAAASASRAFELLEPAARDRRARGARAAGESLRIVRAELGTMAGLIGAGLRRRSTRWPDAARGLRDADRQPRGRDAARARASCARPTSSSARTRGARGCCSTGTASAARLLSYHEHNEAKRTAELLPRLLAGERMALVSRRGPARRSTIRARG